MSDERTIGQGMVAESLLNASEKWTTLGGNQPVREGVVHIFDVDHPDTDTCDAWSSPIEGTERQRFYAVLSISPINSPVDAIRASIVAENR